MTDLARLIEKLAAASEGSRELDLEIARLRDTVVMRRNDDDTANEEYTHWRYTSSIDAALSLVPEGWGAHLVFDKGRAHSGYGCFLDEIDTWAPTRPLALCIASLRARMAS